MTSDTFLVPPKCIVSIIYKHLMHISSGIVVLPDDGAQASKHAGDMHQIYAYNRYFAFSWC